MFALIAAFSVVCVGQKSSPKSVVTAFYKYDLSHSQTFNRKNIDARKQWFSAELYKLLVNELVREAEYLKKNPSDKPHFGDGLPFQPPQENCDANGKSYPRSISYGQQSIKGDLGNVDVYFKYPKACNLPDSDVLYAVNMVKEKGRWVIDDIRYIAENTSLVEDLNRKEY